MPVTAARRYHDPDDEAKLLLGFIAVAAIAGVGYICYARLHIRKEQLMEASLYLLAASFVFWDTLRYLLTLPTERENAWPHPPLHLIASGTARTCVRRSPTTPSSSATTSARSRCSGRTKCGLCRPTASA